jgi:eukaryotic-like serine/threonine-protein kinase
MLSPERWQVVEQVFHQALAIPIESRAEFLTSSCGNDDELRREVESLLESSGDWDAGHAVIAEAASGWAAAEALIGRRVAGYEVLSLLGAGGMGEVFLAEDPTLGRRAALKLLPAPFSKNSERVRRFEQEARAASALNHPNIVTVYQAGEIDGRRFLATEYIEGETLRARLAAGGAQPVAVIGDIVTQVARALAAAHSAGIVHRDIKPENIMVRPDGYVKVLDFGLAKLAPDERFTPATNGGGQTHVGAVMGTPRYMAPEQADGRTVDARADLYSLGVVAHEMLRGTLPAPDAVDGLPPRADARALTPIVMRLLAEDPAARYQTTEDLLADLARAAKPPRSSRRMAAAAAFLVASVTGVAWLASRPTLPASGEAAVSSSPQLLVLPYDSSSLGAELQHLGLGVADGVVSQLSRLQQLQVRPTGSVPARSGVSADPIEIGRRLKVRYVLTGNLSRDEGGISISSSLIDVESGVERWRETATVAGGSALALRNQLSDRIAVRIVETLTRSERPVTRAAGQTSDEAAYGQYLEARALMRGGVAEWQSALKLLQDAVSRDPGYAEAHAALSMVYRQLGTGSGRNTMPRRQAMSLSRESALRALALDDANADAHFALAGIQWGFDWDANAAEPSLRRAAALAPASPEIESAYGRFLVETGRFQEGLAKLERAYAHDPESTYLIDNLVDGYWLSGRPEDALNVAASALRVKPNGAPFHWNRARIFDGLGRHQEAVAERVAAAMANGAPDRAKAVQLAFDTGGYQAVLRREVDARARAGEYVSTAALYTALGDLDQALDALEMTVRERDRWSVCLALDPRFAPLRSHPRFVALMQQIGIQPSAS